MMKMLVLMLGLVFAPVPVWAQISALPAQPHLLVKGQGERTVVPDRFMVSLDLRVTDMDTDVARRKVEDNAAQVLDAFKRNQVIKDSLYASSLGVSPDFEYRDGGREFKGTQVRRQIRGTFSSLPDTQAFLAQVKASPELQISSLQPGYAGEAILRGELKREAGEQTRRTAAKLAEAYGTRIKGLYSVSDVAPDFAYGIQAGTWPTGTLEVAEPRASDGYLPPAPEAPSVVVGGARATDRVESLETGTLTFTENVYAVFLIAP